MMKLNSLIIGLATTLVFGTAFARGGDLVNNGGGLAEKNVRYAYEKLDTYLQMCLKSESCKLNESQKSLVNTMLQNLPAEKASNQLIFASEGKAPGFFIIDGLVRVAKTGSTVGSPIYINSDLLYTKNEAGEHEAMTIPEAVAVLIHELGHHYGNYSHEELDLIGVRASLMLQQKFISTPMMPWNSEISATVFNPNLVSSFPEVLLTVGNDIVDISKQYRDEVQCVGITIPIPILPVPDLELANKKPAASILHNVHWAKMKEKNGFYTVTIVGSVSNNCVYKSNVWIRNNESKVNITFRIRKSESKQAWVFVNGSLAVEQFKDPWWKIIRIPFNPLQNAW